MFTVPINIYGKSRELATEILRKHLSAEYEWDWYVHADDVIVQTARPFYPWRELTGGDLNAYKAYAARQKSLMQQAIVTTEQELANG